MTKSFDPVQSVDPQDVSENLSTNPSSNRSFADVVAVRMSRRSVLGGTLAAAAASGFLAPSALAGSRTPYEDNDGSVGFAPVTIADATVDQSMPTISTDYQYQAFIPWGTPIEPGLVEAYEGDPNSRPTSEQANLQVGIGHDGIAFFPANLFGNNFASSNNRMRTDFQNLNTWAGMLCVNHEFGRNTHVMNKEAPESLEDVRLSQAVHGVSVLAIARTDRGDVNSDWEVIKSDHTRRITVNTPVTFSGPAADSELLQNPNGNVPLGTVNNCGSGTTPWGTYLTCEENFNGYFGANGDFTPTASQERYGFSDSGFGYAWHQFDRRFDLNDADYVNESNRFGWIVEIDPFDASKKPVKRTALGRFKHEAIAIATNSATGRIAAYMGDDQRFDYCYKYVSDLPWKAAVDAGVSPLDEGTLYVARFDDDGTGEWLELSINNPLLANEFANQAELLINARLAADIVGATPMDRPEWTTIGKDGSVFWTLTNNTRREEANAANPEAPNSDGHIIQTLDSDDHLGNTFTWEIFILASSTRDTENVFTDPDAAYADPFGRLFIGTDGGQPDGLQDQVVVFDTNADTPTPVRMLVGVPSDEITGWAYTPDFQTAFTNIQHPGNGSPESTNFPKEFDGVTIPRDATLVISKKNGGIVGS